MSPATQDTSTVPAPDDPSAAIARPPSMPSPLDELSSHPPRAENGRRALPVPDVARHDVAGLMPAREPKRVVTCAWPRTSSSPRSRSTAVTRARPALRCQRQPRRLMACPVGRHAQQPSTRDGMVSQLAPCGARDGCGAKPLSERYAACSRSRRDPRNERQPMPAWPPKQSSGGCGEQRPRDHGGLRRS
jgi:hypothetical protein